jgi:23S rRNA pseudouridine1911/1915/1917 synthase
MPDPRPLLDVLAERFPQSTRSTLRQMLKDKRVEVNGRVVVNAKATVGDADRLRLIDRVKRRAEPLEWPFEVVYEDEHLLVVDKPAGLLTATNPREKRPTLLAMVKQYACGDRDARVGLVHRLDREASGLLVFSKSDEAYESLKDQFYKHTVERVYLAVARGTPNPPKGSITHDLFELPDGRVVRSRIPGKGATATTHYEVVSRIKGRSLLRVTLETGRKHQIRSQLSSRGHPIVGDAMYGGDASDAGLLLRAVVLGVDHPATGERMRWEVAVPEAFSVAPAAQTNAPADSSGA